MIRLHSVTDLPSDVEKQFNIDAKRPLSAKDIQNIRWILESPELKLSEMSRFDDGDVVQIGPRIAMETGDSSRFVAICRRIGVALRRVEEFTRYRVGPNDSADAIIAKHLDPLLQQVYRVAPTSFASSVKPAKPTFVSLANGVDSIRSANAQDGYGIAESLLDFVFELCEGRNPTTAQLRFLGGSLSSHSRHGEFKSPIIRNMVREASTLMQLVQEPWKKNPGNTLVAFRDGSGVIAGHKRTPLWLPKDPLGRSSVVRRLIDLAYLITMETHNHPSYVSPVPGAETGVGGMLRDLFSHGLGTLAMGSICAIYCTGNYHMPEHTIAGEVVGGEKQVGYASAIEAIIGMSDGAAKNANETGVPIAQGAVDQFEQFVRGLRYGWVKPICLVGGTALAEAKYVYKRKMKKGMLVLRAGGLARRVGVGGAAQSSAEGGTLSLKLDIASVQRADAIEESALIRAMKRLAQMRRRNPIYNLGDQGAGGIGNLASELGGTLGNEIDLDKIRRADNTMTDDEMLNAEFQESVMFVIRAKDLAWVQKVFDEEEVNLEVIGKITGTGRFVVKSKNGIIVDIDVEKALENPPWQPILWDHIVSDLPAYVPEPGLSIAHRVRNVFSLLSVGSKRCVITKGDQCVGGRVAQSQSTGPKNMHVSDVAIFAASFEKLFGFATARGLQGVLGIISAKAQGRTAAANLVTNMLSAEISAIPDIKCSLNEIWAVKQPGQGARLYDAIESSCQFMSHMSFAPIRGKDSLSSAAKLANGDTSIGPGQIVVYGIAPMKDIRRKVMPFVKGNGVLFHMHPTGKYRLGGSALAQSENKLGNECPDVEDIPLFNRAMKATLDMHANNVMSAYHNIGRGGFITTVLEMFMAGNCGGSLHMESGDVESRLFHEEPGYVVEIPRDRVDAFLALIDKHELRHIVHRIGVTGTKLDRNVTIDCGTRCVLDEKLTTLRVWWEATSTAIEMRQKNPEAVREEHESFLDEREIPFTKPLPRLAPMINRGVQPRAIVIRAKGTNSYEEMIAALKRQRFDVQNVHMSTILKGNLNTLREFKFLAAPGGFADGDTGGSAKGWAASIRLKPRVNAMFDRFFRREDTASFGECNGAQWMSLMGWLVDSNLPDEKQPRLLKNIVGRFDCRYVAVKVVEGTKAVHFKDMHGAIIGVWTAHGEGRYTFTDPAVEQMAWDRGLVPVVYVDNDGKATEVFPYNPNGSRGGIGALVSENGKHLSMMGHATRALYEWQTPYVPYPSPDGMTDWDHMFRNCREAVD